MPRGSTEEQFALFEHEDRQPRRDLTMMVATNHDNDGHSNDTYIHTYIYTYIRKTCSAPFAIKTRPTMHFSVNRE